MPYTIVWDDAQKTVIRADYTEPLDWEGVLASQREFNREMDSANHLVSLILDFSRLHRLPSGGRDGFQQVSKNFHPQTEVSVLVGMNPFIRLFEKTRCYAVEGRQYMGCAK